MRLVDTGLRPRSACQGSIVGNLELYIPEDGAELAEVRSELETFRDLYAKLQSSLDPTRETQGIWQSVLCSCRDVEVALQARM